MEQGGISLDDTYIKKAREAKTELLSMIYDILNKHNIQAFLTCGTLLGAMREGDFIAWDTDIDIACFNVEEIFKLKSEFEAAGLAVHIKNRSSRFAAKELVIEKIKDSFIVKGVKLHCDVFQFDKTSRGIEFRFNITTPFQQLTVKFLSRIITLKSKDHSQTKHIISVFKPSEETSPLRKAVELLNVMICKRGLHIFDNFSLRKFKFKGIDVYIPNSYAKHLTLLYGKNWRTPNPNYRQSDDRQKNIRRVSL